MLSPGDIEGMIGETGCIDESGLRDECREALHRSMKVFKKVKESKPGTFSTQTLLP